MARQIPIPITELLGNNLPVALKNVNSILDPLFQQIRLTDSSLTDGVLSLAPDEDAAIREWFRSIGDWLASTVQSLPSVLPIPPILQDVVAFDATARRLTLQLAALSDLETNLAGIQGLSFVANPDGFEAIATHTDSGVDVVLAPRFALRFQRNLFEPVRRISSTDGQIRYEPDASRPFTDVDLGAVSFTVNTRDGVRISQDFNSQLPAPVRLVAASNLVIERGNFFLDLRGDRKCLALRWESTQLGNWLGQLAANFREEGPASVAVLTLRMELGDPLESIRLDWRMEGSRRNYLLPGIKVTTPANTEFSMVLESNGADRLSRMLFILTLPQAANAATQSLTAASNFAWSRGGDRELQNDSNPNASANADPLIKADFVPQNRVSLALLDWHFTRSGLPTFLKQVDGGLPDLDFDRSETLSEKGAIALRSLSPSDWNVLPAFNTDAFDFPFLRNDQRDQRISINIGTPQLLLAETRILLEADARVRIGDLLLESGIDFTFNWETFALTVNHDGGLKLSSPESELGPQQYLGLTWRFKGAEQPDGTFHHLTLVTKDYNYQIIQAEGATIELDYTLASDDPITFIVSNLAISDTGITLTAEVSDRPAKLNGLDTRFRFHGSRLEIVDNAIKDFTLAGSGPLPP
ncbi:MAG: hypothetical protein VKL39_00245, partial [Leptolyngbyaceae bacterium]|nr:hypothetical protein [Leptolyngbyaceae bacterium]